MTFQRANFRIVAGPKPPADRLAELNAEALEIARKHTVVWIETLERAGILADQIANGGENYPVGIREIASKLRFVLSAHTINLRALSERT